MPLSVLERAAEARAKAKRFAESSASLGRIGGGRRRARTRAAEAQEKGLNPSAIAGSVTREEATDERSCRQLVEHLAASGLLRYIVPAANGGLAESVEVSSIAAIREELAYADGLIDLLFVMQGLGSFPITHRGTPAQRTTWLERVVTGRAVAALAITEPTAGSDVGAIRTTARREGERYVLDGLKSFISNAPFADLFCIIARTDPEGGRRGLSAFVVERGTPGLHPRGDIALVAPHPIGTLEMNGLRVPVSNRLGEEGEGFAIAMATLDRFRATVGAAAVGFARRALDEALAFAQARVQFGKPLSEFEGIQFKIAEMATKLDAARLLVEKAAWATDGDGSGAGISPLPHDPGRDASMAKLFATEVAQEIVDEALQIHGARGLVRGTIIERLYREVRALRIYEGTSEIQRTIIAGRLLR